MFALAMIRLIRSLTTALDRPADRGWSCVGASPRLGHDEERGGLWRPTARSPACATPGPSTTCIRPSPSRAWRARRRASSPREELKPLAQVNVESLKEYDFFTYAKANGKKVTFVDPVDYSLEFNPKDTVLTLHFLLPLKAPVKAQGARARSVRSELFRRLLPGREGSGERWRRRRPAARSTSPSRRK